MKIESIHNEKVKEWAKLTNKKYRDEKGLFLIEGDHLLKEALKYHMVEEVLSLEKITTEVKNYIVTKEIMKKITNQVTIPKMIGVVKKLKPKEISGSVIFLDGVQDPGNLGTIIRSAVAFSIPNICLTDTCVDLYNPKVIRSTEGMFFSLNFVRGNKKEMLENLKQKGYQIIGTDVRSGVTPSKISYSDKVVLMIGSEGMGMSDEAKSFCTDFVKIPMNPSCESLNASVSASIMMYEYDKQRGHHE